MPFADVLFPRDISYGSQGGPEFSTTIVASGSRREQRNRNLYQPVWKWNVLYGIKTEAQYAELYQFFLVRAGKWQSFRYQDRYDSTLTLEAIALGDGTTTTFQTTKTYRSGADTLVRTVTKLAADATIYVDGVLATNVTPNLLTGEWVFDTAPATGAVIAVTATYHFAARFDTDYLPAISDAVGEGGVLILNIESIPIVESPGE